MLAFLFGHGVELPPRSGCVYLGDVGFGAAVGTGRAAAAARAVLGTVVTARPSVPPAGKGFRCGCASGRKRRCRQGHVRYEQKDLWSAGAGCSGAPSS